MSSLGETAQHCWHATKEVMVDKFCLQTQGSPFNPSEQNHIASIKQSGGVIHSQERAGLAQHRDVQQRSDGTTGPKGNMANGNEKLYRMIMSFSSLEKVTSKELEASPR